MKLSCEEKIEGFLENPWKCEEANPTPSHQESSDTPEASSGRIDWLAIREHSGYDFGVFFRGLHHNRVVEVWRRSRIDKCIGRGKRIKALSRIEGRDMKVLGPCILELSSRFGLDLVGSNLFFDWGRS